MSAWGIFLISACVIIAAGARLAQDSDTIAERTGLGGAWIGAILVAGVTSLPELATGISAVRMGSANLTLGNLFGAIMTNMMVLGVADLINPRVQVLGRVTINQVMVGVLAIMLTATADAGALSQDAFSIAGVGWGTMVTAALYVLGMRLLHINRNEEAFRSEQEIAEDLQHIPPMRPAVIGFAISALAIIVAARYLASSADTLATQMGISLGFAGMILLSAVTTLPEIVVSIAGVRNGAYDMVVGNLFGSNCFNVGILVILDMADGSGPILKTMEPTMRIAALFGILMMGQAILGILHKPQRRVWYLEPHALFLVLTYAAGMFLAYRMGH